MVRVIMIAMTQPNIVLIHCHDLGTRLGCYGQDDVDSPRLDALAGAGVRFTQAFAAAPLCSPARASLFTGTYPARHGVQGLVHRGSHYRPGTATLPSLLAGRGYRTALFGLQHEHADPEDAGFAEVHQIAGQQFCGPVSELAVNWLRSTAPADQEGGAPYFATVGFFETHRPYPAERYGAPAAAELARVQVPPHLPDNELTRVDLAAMTRSIAEADAAVGRVVDAVRARPDADQTMIVFTTDHGIAFPRAKSTLYDAGLQVSLIVVPPPAWGIPAQVADGLISHVDLVPTLATFAGFEHACDGIAQDRVIIDAAPSPRHRIFAAKDIHEIYDPLRLARTETHAYIRNLHPGPRLILPGDIDDSPTRQGLGRDYRAVRAHEELYDLITDPDQLHNRADDPTYTAVLDELRAELDAQLTRTGDHAADAWVATNLEEDH